MKISRILMLGLIAACYVMPLSAQAQYSDDDALNRIASLISGGSTQGKHPGIYREHSQTIVQNWNAIKLKQYDPVTKWLGDNKFTFQNDSLTLYYPFAGPDILFAILFYPQARNYIMGGLEYPGRLIDPDTCTTVAAQNYMNRLRHALRYSKRAGYFITSQMHEDLSQSDLDGVIHLIVFYLGRLNYDLNAVQYFTLNAAGKPVYTTAPQGRGYGVRIDFTDNNRVRRSIYYIRQDLSSYTLNSAPSYHRFVSQFAPFNVLMKSASYILHSNEFNTERDFILKNARQIVQDDSGIPYAILQKNFNVALFGRYSATIKVFDYGFQPNLKKDLDALNGASLPFMLGYNQWVGETVLLYALNDPVEYRRLNPVSQPIVANTTPITGTGGGNIVRSQSNVSATTGISYRVQIFSLSQYKQPASLAPGFNDVSYYQHMGMYKYTVGNFASFEESRRMRQQLVSRGFADAFIVAFRGNDRVDIDDSGRLLN